MNKYYYVGGAYGTLENVPCGMNEGREIWNNLKTDKGAIRRAERIRGPYTLWRFTNFYKDETFTRIGDRHE